MNRYIKRGHVWLLVNRGCVVVISLGGGIYHIEVYGAESGRMLNEAWARSLDAAKTRGRCEMTFVQTVSAK